MKITTFSTLLSVLSIASVVILYVKVDELGDELRLSRSSRVEVGRTAVEREPDLSYRDTSYRTAARDDRALDEGSADTRSADGGEAAEAAGGKAASVEERLARLERDRASPATMWHAPKFARNIDDLSSQLKLTASQKDRVQEALRRGKDRIDAVMSVPGPDGKSPKEVREERVKKMREALANPDKNKGQFIEFAMGGREDLNQRVPGSNETYAQQVKRIQQETRDEVNSGLSPAQQKEFKDTNIDPLVGGSGAATMSFVATTGMGADTRSGAAMIIETADEVSVDTEEEDE